MFHHRPRAPLRRRFNDAPIAALPLSFATQRAFVAAPSAAARAHGLPSQIEVTTLQKLPRSPAVARQLIIAIFSATALSAAMAQPAPGVPGCGSSASAG